MHDGVSASTASCLVCGRDRAHVLLEAPDLEYGTPGLFRLTACDDCGHVSLSPLPDAGDVPGLYPSTYYTRNPDSPLALRGLVYRRKLAGDVARVRRLLRGRRVRSVVDLGCGDAARLVALGRVLDPGVERIGLDLGVDLRQQEAAAKQGVTLVEGDVESDPAALRDAGHDLVLMSQLIEHLRDPRAALRVLQRKLAPAGRLLIETPNRGGLDHVLFRRRHWGGYHVPRHFHLFSPDALARLARETGYRVEARGFLPSPGFWIISLRNRLGLSSARRGGSWGEALNFACLPVVAAFTALDLLAIGLGRPTSNQWILLTPEG